MYKKRSHCSKAYFKDVFLADPILESQDMSTSNTHQQSLVDSGSETRPLMLERGSYIPWASHFRRYLNRKRENRKWLNKAIDEGPYEFKEFTPLETKPPRMQKEEDLKGDNLKHYEAEIEAMNLILISITNDIYNSVDACSTECYFAVSFHKEDPPPEVSMADNRTMAELLQAPTEGYEDGIVIPEIDSLNSAAGGNFLDKIPRECLKIIEINSKVRQSRAKAVVAKVSTNSSTPAISSEVAELKDMVRALLLDKKNQSSAPAQSSTPAPVKAVEPNCVTCGGTLPSNTITNPKEELKGITTESSVAYQGPTIPTSSKVAKQGTEVTKDQVQTPSSAPMPNLKSSIPYPSRRDNERRRDQANEQIDKFYEIFKDMSFEISFTDALIPMPKFASTLKALIRNKEKLSEMARTPMNEHCSTIILNKLLRKLRDPGKFLIPCEFPGMDECLALADLADFMVVDFKPDPRVPLILERCFLKTGRALIDVHKGKLTLRIRNEAITYNLDQTSQEVLGFSVVTASGNPNPHDDPIVSTTSPTLTLFGDSDFLLFEEADAFLEVEKLLDAGLIYPISDSPWVSPIHCVPKKGGFTVVENEENELIPTRLVTGWR
nr:reverse transcriptase domain-containing protein [Tanacetum cinerariifolium]